MVFAGGLRLPPALTTGYTRLCRNMTENLTKIEIVNSTSVHITYMPSLQYCSRAGLSQSFSISMSMLFANTTMRVMRRDHRPRGRYGIAYWRWMHDSFGSFGRLMWGLAVGSRHGTRSSSSFCGNAISNLKVNI